MNLSGFFTQVRAGIDRLAEVLVPNGGALTLLAKLILYVLVFIGLPLLVLVSLPYGVGIILLVAIALLLILGLPGNF